MATFWCHTVARWGEVGSDARFLMSVLKWSEDSRTGMYRRWPVDHRDAGLEEAAVCVGRGLRARANGRREH